MKKKLILGLGRSNVALSKYYLNHQVEFDVFDDGYDADFAVFAKDNKINYYHSKQYKASELTTYSEVIKTPGINPRHNVLFYARKENLPIKTEINVALEKFHGKVVAITGTNGKSTTTHLIYSMLKQQNKDAYLVGNFGYPVIEVLEKTTSESIMVLELSSFQLHYLRDFKPDIAIFTNLSEDHLEWHVGYENYIEDKCNIFANMDINQTLVFNFDDQTLRARAFNSMASLFPVSAEQDMSSNGISIVDNKIIIKQQEIIDCSEMIISGPHNYKNAAMALAVIDLFGFDLNKAVAFLQEYTGLEHRMQLIQSKPFKVFNDSKATNVNAMNTALQAMREDFILIIGGISKKENLDYIAWNKNCKFVFLYGQDGLEFEQYMLQHDVDYKYVENFADAVNEALELAKATNATLLLSPACASFDQHTSFEERGNVFSKIVKEKIWK